MSIILHDPSRPFYCEDCRSWFADDHCKALGHTVRRYP